MEGLLDVLTNRRAAWNGLMTRAFGNFDRIWPHADKGQAQNSINSLLNITRFNMTTLQARKMEGGDVDQGAP